MDTGDIAKRVGEKKKRKLWMARIATSLSVEGL